METQERCRIDLNKSNIVIAIAQLTGPLPDGKRKAVVNDRETFAWKSLDDIKSRQEKAYAILDELSEASLKPDVVVFPEYSFPVQKALPELQKRANEYGFIIIGGADSIWQSGSNDIFNQSPIIIPGREQVVWITKRVVSQWEEGLVDEPAQTTLPPLLTWEAEGREFWISTHICLDFSLASDESKIGGGLFIVPMCSPDMISFLGWADGLLRLKGGTATVLCNCVGEGAKGQSGVVAMNPSGKPFQAALEMSTTKEQVSVFEIDLQRLSPPKRTDPAEKKYPLGRRFLYDLETSGGVQLQTVPVLGMDVRKRGVINPTIFSAVLGKKMRMAFLNVPQYAAVRSTMESIDYEVLAILGKEDLMVTHLADDRYDMIFDVTQAISWIGIRGETITAQDLNKIDENNFPHFRVDTYYKVLGVPVSATDQEIFDSKVNPFPNFADLGKIFALGEQWDDADVTDEERTRFTKNRWILDITEASPGDINAVMTIRLEHARRDIKAHLLAKFEEKVVPDLIDNSQVTSLYRGSSTGLGIDYVLRLSIDLSSGFQSLYQLIERVHELSLDERLKADTTTYIVVTKLAQLSLSKTILVTNLPPTDKRYRDRRINPHLSNDERVRLTYQSEKEQLELINLFKPVDEALNKIFPHLGLEDDAKDILLRRFTSGLFNKEFDSLREVHDLLQARVERSLSQFIREHISEEEFKQLKDKESIQSQKTMSQLNYGEKIKIVVKYIEEEWRDEGSLTAFIRNYISEEEFRHLKDKEGIPSQKSQEKLNYREKLKVVNRFVMERGCLSAAKELNATNKVRNAFAHGDAEQRITLGEFTATVAYYCNFIHAWKKT